ncbi:phosphoadenosine phosphosulfate reductase domain-containing protein [Aegicerativicinus sediminis]|uniref:phosphoadenosine phosphosulfate reductase domain-containing protein n=1 Tax=Aegicerativicinus sediminis TaxID=2893202 RepID=UPI001E5CE097|nr:phosphoadenosine phosphosulfate reductase family protein [Aegicerativicinus sediminis]
MKIQLPIEEINRELRYKSPEEIIDWALTLSENRIVTTSFGVYSAVLLSTFYKKDSDIKVVWCDTLFNNDETYEHALNLIRRFNLNIQHFKPLKSKEQIISEVGLPGIDDPLHKEFTNIVKIEPFKRALETVRPDLWFTNIRVRQTEYRNSKDILSYSKDGILKVSPFYYWSDEDLDQYVIDKNLPKNTAYFDPTKVLNNRECGIHFQ